MVLLEVTSEDFKRTLRSPKEDLHATIRSNLTRRQDQPPCWQEHFGGARCLNREPTSGYGQRA